MHSRRWSRFPWTLESDSWLLGKWSRVGTDCFLLNSGYRRWWRQLHPAVVTCGRETVFPYESSLLVVPMVRGVPWRVPGGLVSERLGCGVWGWSLPDDCVMTPIYAGRKEVILGFSKWKGQLKPSWAVPPFEVTFVCGGWGRPLGVAGGAEVTGW